jgi:hypothetical protein
MAGLNPVRPSRAPGGRPRKDAAFFECVERSVEVEPLLNDGDKDINRNGDPDLRLHCALRGAVKPLYADMDSLAFRAENPRLLVPRY